MVNNLRLFVIYNYNDGDKVRYIRHPNANSMIELTDNSVLEEGYYIKNR